VSGAGGFGAKFLGLKTQNMGRSHIASFGVGTSLSLLFDFEENKIILQYMVMYGLESVYMLCDS
jgi:hypothetical protein